MKIHSQTANNEWGRKARKLEDSLRGLNHTDARRAIAEELQAIADHRAAEAAEIEAFNLAEAEWEAEYFARMMDETFASYLDEEFIPADDVDWTLEIDGYADLSDYETDIYAGTADA